MGAGSKSLDMTWFPGEALIIRMWDTLVDHGLGSLLRPWQIKREAAAQLAARKAELIGIAHAQMEVEAMESGRATERQVAYRLGLKSLATAPAELVRVDRTLCRPWRSRTRTNYRGAAE